MQDVCKAVQSTCDGPYIGRVYCGEGEEQLMSENYPGVAETCREVTCGHKSKPLRN